MSEFRTHILLKTLIDYTGSSEPPEKYAEQLQKSERYSSIGQNAVTQSSIRQVAQRSPSPATFIAKYEELESKNTRSLEPFVQLLSQISDHKQLKDFLERNYKKAHERRKQTTTSQSDERKAALPVTKESLPKVVNRIFKESNEGEKKIDSVKVEKGNQDNQAKSRHPTYHAPRMINWKVERPNVNFDFVYNPGPNSIVGALGVVPPESQESILIWDLLNILQGVEGAYIIPDDIQEPYGIRTFGITPSIDLGLCDLVKKFLPLASHYSMIVRFTQDKMKFEYGQVNHALVAAIEDLLKEYLLAISQLESLAFRGNLNLHEMWFYIQPIQRIMDVLSRITSSISKANARGGKVLSLLHEITSSFNGDFKVQEMCLHLTQAACAPYMEILERWIYKGVISDPYCEFSVEDNEVIQKEELPLDYSADYWEKRYTIRRDRIPVFLEHVSDVILRTGKYLNVIRQCGKHVRFPDAEKITYTIKERKYVEVIENAYKFASKTLLELLMKENDLMGRLRSVKHYFLLDQGDFIVQFMEYCEKELSKNLKDIEPTRLESLLELVLRTSTANVDPYKDDMRTELLPYDLICQMFKILSIGKEEEEYDLPLHTGNLTGILAFSFGYEVKWPVSLVLNRKAIACYQMLFRHLFYCKHIERLLCRVWKANKMAKLFPHESLRMYVPAFALRMRMLDCVQNLEYYMMVEVIEPNWVIFLSKMSKVTNVDEVLACHSDFLDSCLKDCMLTNPDLLRTLYKMLEICTQFYDFMKSPEPLNECEESEHENFEQTIAKFNLKFTSLFLSLLHLIRELGRDNSNEKLINLLYRFDFNGCYSEQLQKFNMCSTSEEKLEDELSG